MNKLTFVIYTYNISGINIWNMILSALIRYRAIVTESLVDEHDIRIPKRKLDSLDGEDTLASRKREEWKNFRNAKYISLDMSLTRVRGNIVSRCINPFRRWIGIRSPHWLMLYISHMFKIFIVIVFVIYEQLSSNGQLLEYSISSNHFYPFLLST